MRRLILAALALLAGLAQTQAQQFPLTMPSNTVYGRLGIGTGPGQAIPFATLFSSSGFLNNARHAVTASYTAVSTDCGATIAARGTAFYTVTFGAASGYTSNCTLIVLNEDTGRAKDVAISGGTTFRLYPGQSAIVYSQNSVWNVIRDKRYRLTGTFAFYIDNTAADDTKDGMQPGAANAFKTIQAAIDRVCNDFDIGGQQVNVQLTSGQTYAENLVLCNYGPSGNIVATAGNPTILGEVANPQNYIINGAGGTGIAVLGVNVPTPWIFNGVTINAAAGTAVEADINTTVYLKTVRFGAAATHVMAVNGGSRVEFLANYEIFGGATTHIISSGGGLVLIQPGKTVTLTGTPAFASAFVSIADNGMILFKSTTFSGAATGARFIHEYGSVMDVGGGDPNAYWPGNANGAYTPQTIPLGGTGIGSYTIGDLLYASGGTTLSKLADVATGSVLASGGVGVAPAWSSSPALTTSLTVPIVYGGSGVASTLDLRATSGAGGGSEAVNIKAGSNGATLLASFGVIGTGNGALTMTSTDPGAGVGPYVILDRNSASPAASDGLGKMIWQGRNLSAAAVVYGFMSVQIETATAGAEDSRFQISSIRAGAQTDDFFVGGGVGVGTSTRSGVGSLVANTSIKSQGATGGVGYATGAGGTVTQSSSKATAVTLNTVTGAITLNNAALAAATIVTFVLNNSAVAATDQINATHESAGTTGAYTINCRATGSGTAACDVRNNTAGSLSEAIVIRFSITKSVNS